MKDDAKVLVLTPTGGTELSFSKMGNHHRNILGSRVGMGLESGIRWMIYSVRPQLGIHVGDAEQVIGGYRLKRREDSGLEIKIYDSYCIDDI